MSHRNSSARPLPAGLAQPQRRCGAAAAGDLSKPGSWPGSRCTAVGHIPHAVHPYRKETLRLIAQIGMGTGAMAVIGGTAAIVGFVTLVR